MKIFHKLHKIFFAAAAVLTAGLSALTTGCNNASTIGGDLTGDEISIIVDSSFTVTGSSVRTPAVLSRTVTQLLGIVDVEGYGYIRSDFVTQFMPTNAIDTTGITVDDIDAIKLFMNVSRNNFTGDSLALMGLEVYPLTRQLSVPIYSNFDPEGYYDPSDCIASAIYNLAKNSETDSLKRLNYHTLEIGLPIEMGRRFFTEYVERPATYASPSAFANFFPGLYVRNSYGSGRITRVGNTVMKIFYHQNTVNDKGNDTTYYKTGTYFAVTPEIISNNDITLDIDPAVTALVDGGEAIMLAPAGLDVEMRFPGREVIAAFNKGVDGALGVVNRLTMKLPVENVANDYGIGAPTDVLLILRKDRDDFFLNNKLPDNVTSFRATLSTAADGSQSYNFTDMRQYLLDLMAKESVADEDVDFVLVPVAATEESNTDYYGNVTVTLTALNPYVTEPRMTRILLDKAKINFVYSRQSTKF